MRADRLVAVLLLLQQRGHVTAAEVAAELEVSERTARRDLDALGTAGLPVYSLQGRGGGWRLAGGGRTDLSGLTAAEARALFLLAGPRAGATPEVRAALRKLLRALPEPLRAGAEAASTAVLVDEVGWDRRGSDRPPPPHLAPLQEAVVDGVQVELGYVARGGAETRRTVHPLGIAAKGSWWYLIADTDAGRRMFRVDRVTEVTPTGQPVVRPPDFDLAEVWARAVDEVDRMRAPVVVRAAADRSALRYLQHVLGSRVAVGGVGPTGRIEIEVRGHSIVSLTAELAGFGSLLEVHEPTELRRALAELGADLVAAYADDGPADG